MSIQEQLIYFILLKNQENSSLQTFYFFFGLTVSLPIYYMYSTQLQELPLNLIFPCKIRVRFIE